MKYLLLLCILLTSCSQMASTHDGEIDKLPKETHFGAKAMGFLLNGKAWYTTIEEGNETVCSAMYQKGQILLQARKNKGMPIFQSIAIIGTIPVHDLHKTCILNCWDDKCGNGAEFNNNLESSCGEYHSDANQTGKLNIAYFDTVNHIISGTFSFKLWKAGCDTLNITDGRFDMKY